MEQIVEEMKNNFIKKIIEIFSTEKVKAEIAKYALAIKDQTIKYSENIKIGTVKCASDVKDESKRYLKGVKGEAVETKEAFLILAKYMKKEDITKEEKKIFCDQMVDLLKAVGIVLPLQLIPLPFVSTLLMIVLDHTLQMMHIQILPSSFYPPKSDLLTPEAIKTDLTQYGKEE